MVRVLGQPGDPATHLENRVGEPAANPYLYMASQIYAGLDGIARRLEPGPSADTPYEASAPLLPENLGEALTALRADDCFRAGFGDAFVDYYAHIKEAELDRFRKEAGRQRRGHAVGTERISGSVLERDVMAGLVPAIHALILGCRRRGCPRQARA